MRTSVLVRAWAALMLLGAVVWPGTISAQPDSVVFKKGQMQFKRGGTSFTLPLVPGEYANSLDTRVLGGQASIYMLGLIYSGPQGSGQNVRMALQNLSGPGKYEKASIYNLVVETGSREPSWYFNGRTDDCTLVFTRLDASEVKGAAMCTAAGGKVPFTDMKFTASPG